MAAPTVPSAGVPTGSVPAVSIVVPTFNRIDRLRRCVEMVRAGVGVSREVIVVDGGSTDGTREWLSGQDDLRVILEPRREGAVRAFNKGFRAATGRYVTWLNDDAYPLPGAVEAAIAMIERPDLADVGMVAFYHDCPRRWNRLHSVVRDGAEYSIYAVRGYPYANFGLLRRELLERVGYADEGYYFFGFDPDLSLKVQLEAGLKVVGCPDALIHHDELPDDRKTADLPAGDADNERLFAKWPLPAKGSYPDPAAGYADMLRARGVMR